MLGFHQKASICLGKFVEGDSAGTVIAFYVSFYNTQKIRSNFFLYTPSSLPNNTEN